MIRLGILLSGAIWAVMAFSPDLDGPVFTEIEQVPDWKITTPTPTVVVQAKPAVDPTPEVIVADVTPAAEPQRIIWAVTGSRVNVRQGPSTDYSVMGQVIRGDLAEIISDPTAKWVKIRIEGDGVEGFIMKQFMDTNGENS